MLVARTFSFVAGIVCALYHIIKMTQKTLHGIVIRNTGSHYIVRTDDGRGVPCKVKGNFRLKGIRSTNPVAVGDGVTINMAAEGETATTLSARPPTSRSRAISSRPTSTRPY